MNQKKAPQQRSRQGGVTRFFPPEEAVAPEADGVKSGKVNGRVDGQAISGDGGRLFHLRNARPLPPDAPAGAAASATLPAPRGRDSPRLRSAGAEGPLPSGSLPSGSLPAGSLSDGTRPSGSPSAGTLFDGSPVPLSLSPEAFSPDTPAPGFLSPDSLSSGPFSSVPAELSGPAELPHPAEVFAPSGLPDAVGASAPARPSRRLFLLGLAGLALTAPVPAPVAAATAQEARTGPARAGAGRKTGMKTGGETDRIRSLLVRHIREAIGKPYRWGATGPAAFDCSGLVLWLYARVGVRLPRLAVQQGRVGARVRRGLTLGDALLFSSSRSPSGWHIGLYLDRGYFVHAAGRRRGVVVSPLDHAYARRLVVVRRYLA